jgi:single-stranded-DNA-specific exonuclease
MLNGTDLLDILLSKRGIIENLHKDIFLNPNYSRDLHDPFLMRDMDLACTRIFDAVQKGEKIVIYADYDCDGIPGAIVLQDLFKEIKYENFEVYIPARNSEGYGLNLEAIESFVEAKVKLLITIDLGITAVEEVDKANQGGIDVIVTDHHLPRPASAGIASFDLPKAFAILNPKVDEYPEKMLCGAGVAFKLAQGFLKKYGEYFKIKEGVEKWMLDMVGLATLSDMVPLLGENRALSYFGMKVLRRSPRPGLQKLLAQMKIEQKFLTEDDVGFMIVPRLNAASRMDSPRRAFELLATDDEVEGGMLAAHLSKINDERKNIVTGIMREVNKKLEEREEREVVVIGNPTWRVGVLGLVAGKICDQYKKPVFVWGQDENEMIKGSCRSDGSVSVVELMSLASESFLNFGGHELAGGFTVNKEKIHFLEEFLSDNFKKLKKEKESDQVEHDLVVFLNQVNLKNHQEIDKMSPFGIGNPKPLFLFPNVKISKIKKFGKNGSGEHLEIVFKDGEENTKKAISFFSGLDSFSIPLLEGKEVNLLAHFDLSRFRGKEELRLRVKDIY